MRKPEEAKKLLGSVLQEDPRNVHALISLATILRGEGEGDDVIRLCWRALDVDERNTVAHSLMGQVYMNRQDYSDARPCLQKAVEIQPKMTQNRLNLAACMIGLQQYADARRVLDEILAGSPNFPMAHFNMGLLEEGLGRLPEAIRAYRDEIGLHDGCFMARFNLGRLLMRTGNVDGYMDQMREVIRTAPKSPLGYLFLARGLLQQNGDTGEILEMANKGLELAKSPEHKALAYFLLADAYGRGNQPQQAQQALAEANRYKSQIEK